MSIVVCKRRVMSITPKGAIVLFIDLTCPSDTKDFSHANDMTHPSGTTENFVSSTSLIDPLSKVASTLGVIDLLEWDHWVMSTTLEVSYFRYQNSHLCKWRVMCDSSAWSKLLLRYLNRVRGMRADSAQFVMVSDDLYRFWII